MVFTKVDFLCITTEFNLGLINGTSSSKVFKNDYFATNLSSAIVVFFL